jgi:transcriptional regulator with XRE-family HTH domain
MPLDLENLSRKIDELHPLTQEALARYARINGAYVSMSLRGTKPLTLDLARTLNATLDELLRIKKILEPIPVDFRRCAAIEILLERLRNGVPLIPPEAQEPPPLAAMTNDDCWSLLQDILTRDSAVICLERNWTRIELAEKLAEARLQLSESTRAISAR